MLYVYEDEDEDAREEEAVTRRGEDVVKLRPRLSQRQDVECERGG